MITAPVSIELSSVPGFRLRELTSVQLQEFIDLGVQTCAFMHGRPEMPADKMTRYFSSFVKDYGFIPDSEIHFVESPDGEYAGQIWLHTVRNAFNRQMEMWIWDLTVAGKFRRRGIGRALIHFAGVRAEQLSCSELWLLVSHANADAIRLYEAMGMQTKGLLMMRPTPLASGDTHKKLLHNAVLRPLIQSDINKLYKLWERSELPFRPTGRDREDLLFAFLSGPRPSGWGCEINGDLVAGALVSYDGRKGWIEHLAVAPEHRKAGLARATITACRQTLKERGALVIAALIADKNTASRRLFESCGFSYDPNVCYYSQRDDPAY